MQYHYPTGKRMGPEYRTQRVEMTLSPVWAETTIFACKDRYECSII